MEKHVIIKDKSLDPDDIIVVDKTIQQIRASNSMSAHSNPHRR